MITTERDFEAGKRLQTELIAGKKTLFVSEFSFVRAPFLASDGALERRGTDLVR